MPEVRSRPRVSTARSPAAIRFAARSISEGSPPTCLVTDRESSNPMPMPRRSEAAITMNIRTVEALDADSVWSACAEAFASFILFNSVMRSSRIVSFSRASPMDSTDAALEAFSPSCEPRSKTFVESANQVSYAVANSASLAFPASV